MANALTPAATPRWGTLAWFADHYRSGDPTDPTAYFSHEVNGYELFRHETLCRWAAARLAGTRTAAIADIGCGAGALTARFVERLRPARAVGIDFLPDAIDRARGAYPTIEFRVGALPEIDLSDAGFDLVVASEVLYYLDADQRRRAIDEVARILRPGGTVFFTSRLGDRYFSRRSAEELVASRFEVLDSETLHNRLYSLGTRPLRGARRLADLAARGSAADGSGRARRWWRRAVQYPASQAALRGVGTVERRLLRSRALPEACHRFCRVAAPRLTATTIALLARKAAS